MIADRLARIQERVHSACASAGRDPQEVTLIAVSKTVPSPRLQEALDHGHLHYGESYAQELRDKARELAAAPGLSWHFIGRLQTNKAKYIAPVAHRVHALERVEQAEALSRRLPDGRTLKCLLSVRLGDETSKGGVAPDEAIDRGGALSEVPGIEVVGLMTLPPFTEDPEATAPYFERLAALAARGRDQGLRWNELSMGMSHDFEVAIRCGATWIRVGTAIFGPRRP